MTELPKIGEIITSERAIELCNHFEFYDISRRIGESPEEYLSWEFDGGSKLPDELVARVFNVDESKLIEVFLKHDLWYAYGLPGDRTSKLKCDWHLGIDLLDIGIPEEVARAAVVMVDMFGRMPESGFEWGFASVIG